MASLARRPRKTPLGVLAPVIDRLRAAIDRAKIGQQIPKRARNPRDSRQYERMMAGVRRLKVWLCSKA